MRTSIKKNKGECHVKKLTFDVRKQIVMDFIEGETSLSRLSRKYEVDRGTIRYHLIVAKVYCGRKASPEEALNSLTEKEKKYNQLYNERYERLEKAGLPGWMNNRDIKYMAVVRSIREQQAISIALTGNKDGISFEFPEKEGYKPPEPKVGKYDYLIDELWENRSL